MKEHELANLSDEELLRYVDRSDAEVAELARRLETVLDRIEMLREKLWEYEDDE